MKNVLFKNLSALVFWLGNKRNKKEIRNAQLNGRSLSLVPSLGLGNKDCNTLEAQFCKVDYPYFELPRAMD
jgi:hypothetical protein